MTSRLRFALSQLGPKPGAAQVRAVLLEPADLPGDGWSVLDDRTWRTGTQRPVEPWAARAAAMRSITAWRSFRAGERYLWVQIVPTASPEDAHAALRAVPSAGLRDLRATVEPTGRRDVPAPHVPGAAHTWAVEHDTTGGSTLMLGWTAGAHLLVLAASGTPAWTWAEVADLARRQTQRLDDR